MLALWLRLGNPTKVCESQGGELLHARLRLTADEAAREIERGTLVQRLADAPGRAASEADLRSWNSSIPVLIDALVRCNLTNVTCLFELRMPQSNQVADVVLIGLDEHGKPVVLVFENKQWSSLTLSDDAESVVVPGLGLQGNPIDQAWKYCQRLWDFLEYLTTSNATVAGAVNLHNGSTADADLLRSLPAGDLARSEIRVFGASDLAELERFLIAHLAPGVSTTAVADAFLSAEIAPTRRLMRAGVSVLEARNRFVLLDEQQVAFEAVLSSLRTARQQRNSPAVIITGGPGTGKTVIAIELMRELAAQDQRVVYVTGSKAVTITMRRSVGGEQGRNLFGYFHQFADSEPQSIDVVLCDEAHRLRKSGASRFRRSTGLTQIQEILRAARVPVFFVDDDQIVREREIGSVDYIRQACQDEGVEVVEIDLQRQFRCATSLDYVDWVSRLLSDDPQSAGPWNPDWAFDLRLVSTPEELEDYVQSQDSSEHRNARMVAGFCWPWSDAPSEGPLVNDVVIGDWERPWNARKDAIRGDFPPSDLWATDERGLSQVGCIYTAQGFEFTHCGVIMGPDLVIRDGKWVAHPDQNFDRLAKGEHFKRNVRNAYRVLMTRGMNGAALLSLDTESHRFLQNLGVPQWN